MIDWLRQNPRQEPQIELGDICLPIVVRRQRNAKRMTLRLAPDGREVRVTIPDWCRTVEALKFAHSRADWLTAQLTALPAADVTVARPSGPKAVRVSETDRELADRALAGLYRPPIS